MSDSMEISSIIATTITEYSNLSVNLSDLDNFAIV